MIVVFLDHTHVLNFLSFYLPQNKQTNKQAINLLIVTITDISMFSIKYLAIHNVQMHADAFTQLLYGMFLHYGR